VRGCSDVPLLLQIGELCCEGLTCDFRKDEVRMDTYLFVPGEPCQGLHLQIERFIFALTG
jgi:hypothetical protein